MHPTWWLAVEAFPDVPSPNANRPFSIHFLYAGTFPVHIRVRFAAFKALFSLQKVSSHPCHQLLLLPNCPCPATYFLFLNSSSVLLTSFLLLSCSVVSLTVALLSYVLSSPSTLPSIIHTPLIPVHSLSDSSCPSSLSPLPVLLFLSYFWRSGSAVPAAALIRSC